MSLGEKTTTRRKTKKLFRNFDSCCFFLLLIVHSLACLQTQSNSDFYFERKQNASRRTTARKKKEWFSVRARTTEQPAAKRQKQTTTGNESNTASKKDQKITNIPKTHNIISCLQDRITKRTACISQTCPPEQVACGIEPQRSERKREKEFFPFAQRPQQKPQSLAKRNNRFLSRQQTTLSSSCEPVAIALSPHQHHK